MLLPKKWLLLAFCLVVSGCAHKPQTAPPAAPVEAKPPIPHSGAVWIPGHHKWSGGKYVWIPGRWASPQAGKKWVPGHWQKTPRGYRWVEGHWAATGAPAKPVPPPPHKKPPRRR